MSSIRVIANYLMWRLVMGLAPELPQAFQEVRNNYRKVLYVGTFLAHCVRVTKACSVWLMCEWITCVVLFLDIYPEIRMYMIACKIHRFRNIMCIRTPSNRTHEWTRVFAS